MNKDFTLNRGRNSYAFTLGKNLLHFRNAVHREEQAVTHVFANICTYTIVNIHTTDIYTDILQVVRIYESQILKYIYLKICETLREDMHCLISKVTQRNRVKQKFGR